MRTGLLSVLKRILRPSRTRTEAGQAGTTATRRIPPPRSLSLSYAPNRDGAPDAGEVVWTWVPFDENDGRGKDRPLLVIARQNRDRVYAMRLTSTPHPGDARFVPLGAGEWDAAGRASWLDLEHVYSVHERGLRREASALPPDAFARVAGALRTRYGWRGTR